MRIAERAVVVVVRVETDRRAGEAVGLAVMANQDGLELCIFQ